MKPLLNSHLESGSNPVSLPILLNDQLEAINACVLEKIQSSVPLIPQVAGYLISLGGKRLRPLLTVASAELYGYRGQRHIHLAACVEFIHTATLLHDDVVDDSVLRRGKPTANTLWTNQASVLVGDFLFSKAFELMVEDQSLEVLRILSKVSSRIVEGEVLQLSSSNSLDLNKDTYLDIINAKTAQLFSAAAEVGVVVAEAGHSQRKSLASFGHALGMAFQLMDDILDYAASEHKLGKTIGDDFREGKVTLPVIFAYEQGEERSFWESMFNAQTSKREEDLTKAIQLLNQSGALLKTKELAQNYIEKALDALSPLPPHPLKAALEDVACFALSRES